MTFVRQHETAFFMTDKTEVGNSGNQAKTRAIQIFSLITALDCEIMNDD